MDELKESTKTYIEDKFKSPLWSYIIASWLIFNWSNIAFLLMSNAKVEDRISAILNQDFLYLKYLIFPVISGSVLAIISPYLHGLLVKWHSAAWNKDMDTRILREKKLVLLNRAQEKANQEFNDQFKKTLDEEEKKQEAIRADTRGLQKSLDILNGDHQETEKKLAIKRSEYRKKQEELNELIFRTARVANVLNAYTPLTEVRSVKVLQQEIAHIISNQELKDVLTQASTNDETAYLVLQDRLTTANNILTALNMTVDVNDLHAFASSSPEERLKMVEEREQLAAETRQGKFSDPAIN